MDLYKLKENFDANLKSVDKLVNFDTDVQTLAIDGIKTLHEKLKAQGIDNPALNGERTLQMLQGVHDNKSLKPRFKIIYNQAIVLLVSYFGSVLGDLFRYAATEALNYSDPRIMDVELKLRVSEISSISGNPENVIGDLLILKDDITFQDMGSTHRAFKKYYGITIGADVHVQNIILAQACRHVIVHSAGIVNERTINQIRVTKERTIKVEIRSGENISFSIEEVGEVAKSMREYVKAVSKLVEDKIVVSSNK